MHNSGIFNNFFQMPGEHASCGPKLEPSGPNSSDKPTKFPMQNKSFRYKAKVSDAKLKFPKQKFLIRKKNFQCKAKVPNAKQKFPIQS